MNRGKFLLLSFIRLLYVYVLLRAVPIFFDIDIDIDIDIENAVGFLDRGKDRSTKDWRLGWTRRTGWKSEWGGLRTAETSWRASIRSLRGLRHRLKLFWYTLRRFLGLFLHPTRCFGDGMDGSCWSAASSFAGLSLLGRHLLGLFRRIFGSQVSTNSNDEIFALLTTLSTNF